MEKQSVFKLISKSAYSETPFDEFEKHLCNKCGGFMLPE